MHVAVAAHWLAGWGVPVPTLEPGNRATLAVQSMETGTHWQNPGTPNVSTGYATGAAAYEGSRSVLFTRTAPAGDDAWTVFADTTVAVTEGERLTVSVWVKASEAGITVTPWYDVNSATGYLTGFYSFVPPALTPGVWTLLTHTTDPMPAGATSFVPRMAVYGGGQGATVTMDRYVVATAAVTSQAVTGSAGIAPVAALGSGTVTRPAAQAVTGSAGIAPVTALGTGSVVRPAAAAVAGSAGIAPVAALGTGSVAPTAAVTVTGTAGIAPRAALGTGDLLTTGSYVLEGEAGIPPVAALGTGEVAATAGLAVVGTLGIAPLAALGVGEAVQPQVIVGTEGIAPLAALGQGSLPLYVSGVNGNNLLADGGFERTVAGATAQGTGTAVFRDNDEQVHGDGWSLKVVPGAPGAGYGVQTIGGGGPTPGVPVTANEVYTSSAWVWANAGETLRFTVRYAASPSTFLTSDTTWSEAGWRRLTATNRSPATATNLSLKVETVATSTGAAYFVDDVQIERNGAATEYGSGGIPSRAVLGVGAVTRGVVPLAVVGSAGIAPQAALGTGDLLTVGAALLEGTAGIAPRAALGQGSVATTPALAVVGTAGIPTGEAFGTGVATGRVVGSAGIVPLAALGQGAVTRVVAGSVQGTLGIAPQAALGTGEVVRPAAAAVAGASGIAPTAALGVGVVRGGLVVTGTTGIAPRAALGSGATSLRANGLAGIAPRAALGVGAVTRALAVLGAAGIAPRAAVGVGVVTVLNPYRSHETGYDRLPYDPGEAVLARVQGHAYVPLPPAAVASVAYAPGEAVLTPQRGLAVLDGTRGYATMEHQPAEADLPYAPGFATIDKT